MELLHECDPEAKGMRGEMGETGGGDWMRLMLGQEVRVQREPLRTEWV